MYKGGNCLETARQHFLRAEEKMLYYYNNIEPNYKYQFNNWTLKIWSNDFPENLVEIDLAICSNWNYEENLGITFRMNEQRCCLFFDDKTFFEQSSNIEFFGLNEFKNYSKLEIYL